MGMWGLGFTVRGLDMGIYGLGLIRGFSHSGHPWGF